MRHSQSPLTDLSDSLGKEELHVELVYICGGCAFCLKSVILYIVNVYVVFSSACVTQTHPTLAIFPLAFQAAKNYNHCIVIKGEIQK